MNLVMRFAGYFLLFVLALVPSFIGMQLDATANQVGMIYVGTLAFATMGWMANTMFKEEKPVRARMMLVAALLFAGLATWYYGAEPAGIALYVVGGAVWLGAGWLCVRLVEAHEPAI
ncbi:MAG: hypothetical protein R6W82_00555 [bacterium]